MPNKKVELILMFTTKKFFLRVTHFFQKIALNQLRQAKYDKSFGKSSTAGCH